MSKVTKLLNNPNKFFKDFIIKRIKSIDVKFEDSNFSDDTNLYHDFNSLLNIEAISTLIHCGEGLTAGRLISEIWLNLLNNKKNNFVFLIRNRELFEEIKYKYSGFNIVYAKAPTDIENLLSKLKKIKNICFVSNTANNIHLIRFNEYRHIYIGNFDESRQPNVHKYFRAYDEIWLYSEQTYNDLLAILDIKHLEAKIINNPMFSIKKNNEKRNFVYWCLDSQDAIYNSLSLLPDILSLSCINGKFLNIYTSDLMKNAISNHMDKYKINSFSDPLLLGISDLVIMDYNYTKTLDALKLGVPVLVFMPKENLDLADLDHGILSLCYQFSNIYDLDDIVNKINLGVDPLYTDRVDFLKLYFGIVTIEEQNFNSTINQLFTVF